MTHSERIREILKYLGLNQSQLADNIGVSPDTINKIFNGHRDISKNLASKICDKYPEIYEAWLLTGVGNMVTTGEDYTTYPDFEGKKKEMKKYRSIDLLSRIQELEDRCQRYEETIDTFNKSIGILENEMKNQSGIQIMMKEFEEKCEKILTGSVNKNFEKLTEEFEGKILRIIKKGKQDL